VTQRDRIVLGVVATLAVIAGFWFLVLSPKRDEVSKATAEVGTAQARLDAARLKLAAGEAAKREYNKQLLTIARLGKAVPPTEDTPSLLYQLQRTAENAGVDFRSLTIEAAPAAAAAAAAPAPTDPAAAGTTAPVTTEITPIPFNVKFRGEFSQLRKFMLAIQSYAKPKGDTLDVRGRLLTVDGIAMTPDKADFPMVSAELVVTAYKAPLADATAQPVAGATPGTATPSSAEPAPGTTAQNPTNSTAPPAIVGGLLP
jgi:Tfp pilus assembly protein PilO